MDDKIETLQSFTMGQLTRDEAIKFLKVSNNDVNTAVNKFYDQGMNAIKENNNVADEGWDNNVFHADRYGQQDGAGNALPSFNIEYAPGVDNYPHSGAGSVAPSRPPSRTSHHSGTSPAQVGDTPMQSIENGQESGLIGNSRPVFGPANRDYYEAAQWALVPLTSSAEYIPDVAASQRKREEGSPAILKPLPNEDYLPALITILRSIPLFRNALLAPEITLDNYKVGDEWWKGTASTQARTVEYESSMETTHNLEIIHETQRLMAFLDKTDRAYGSVGALLQLEAMKNSRIDPEQAEDDLLKFLVNWDYAYQTQTSKELNGVLKSIVRAQGQSQECFLLDGTVVHNDPKREKTLYDVLNDTLFASATQQAHIVDISNVLVFRLVSSKTDSNLNCKFPATFYADQYLEENKMAVDTMFQDMNQYEQQLKDLDAEVDNLKYHTTKKVRPGEKMEVLKLLKSSMVAFQPKEDDLIEDPSNAATLSRLQAVYNNIEQKLNVLEEQKNKAREELDKIASRFKAPFDDGTLPDTSEQPHKTDPNRLQASSDNPAPASSSHKFTHRYKLCGVSTRSGVYYLPDPETQRNEPSANQWWRIEYSVPGGSEAFIFTERYSLSKVLEKISTEHKSALLVYANEAATSPVPIPLSEPLQQFVKDDNVRFLEELQVIEPIGEWNNEPTTNSWPRDKTSEHPPTYADDWAFYGGTSTISAFGNQFQGHTNKGYTEQKSGDSEMSSTTLTPNTDIEDDGIGGTEMQEVNGGISAWAGGMSSASSDTVGGEPMDVVKESQSQQTVNMREVEMVDVDLTGERREEPRVEHIEHLEKKDG